MPMERGGMAGGRCSRRPPRLDFSPPPCIPPHSKKWGAGGCKGGNGGRGARQRPRLSSTDERCIPSYRGDGESCAAASPPPPAFFFCKGRGGSQQLTLRGGLPACFAK
nr:hypothetical protein [Morchella crassipes]